MSRHLFLALSKAWHPANRGSFYSSAAERPAHITTLKRQCHRRKENLFVCSECTSGRISAAAAAANRTSSAAAVADRVKRVPMRRSQVRHYSTPKLGGPHEVVAGYQEKAAGTVDATATFSMPLETPAAIDAAWNMFLRLKDTPHQSDPIEGEIRHIFNVLASGLRTGKSAEKLRSVALYMKRSGFSLALKEAEHLIIAQRILRNWSELLTEYRSLRYLAKNDAAFLNCSSEVYECVVAALLELGNHDAARAMLVELEQNSSLPTVRMFINLFRSALSRNDMVALEELYQSLVRQGIPLNIRCFAILMTAWKDDKGRIEELLQSAQHSNLGDFEADIEYQEAAIAASCRAGFLEHAYDQLTRFRHKHPKSESQQNFLYAAMIREHLHRTKDPQQALNTAESLFAEMMRLGIAPTVRTYTVLMHGYFKHRSLNKVLETYEAMVKSGLEADSTVFNVILRACVLHGDLAKMEEVFSRLLETGLEPSLHILTSVMAGFAWHGRVDEAVTIFEQRIKENSLEPDVACYNVLILGFGLRGDVNGCIQWWNKMLEQGLSPDRISYTSFMEALSKSGDTRVESMYQRVFTTEVEPDERSYGLLVKDRIRRGELDSAVQIWTELLANGLNMGPTSVANLMEAFQVQDNIPFARDLLRRFVDKGGVIDVHVYGVMMNMLQASSRPDEIIRMWHGMTQQRVEPTERIYRHVIKAHVAEKDAEGLWATVEDMRSRLFVPPVRLWEIVISFLTTLRGAPNVDRAYQYMLEDNVTLSALLLDRLVESPVAEADPELVIHIMRHCLQKGEKAMEDVNARRFVYRYFVNLHDQRYMAELIGSIIKSRNLADLRDIVETLWKARNACGLLECWNQLLRYDGSKRNATERILSTLQELMCVNIQWRDLAAGDVIEKLFGRSLGLESESRALQTLQKLHDSGHMVQFWRCWDIALEHSEPDNQTMVSHLLSGALEWAFIRRRIPIVGRNLWTRLVDYPNHISADIVLVYVRCLASSDDIDEIVKMATVFLLHPAYTHMAEPIVNGTLGLIRWKWPLRVNDVIAFWETRNVIDIAHLKEEFL
ncbi:hypothetical protein DFJ77DRAFT_475636 [Powellomyces hirtus]|nr:hypothetical protein DFJ77DRAFT_475636 [Powellomyces hirtus]